MYRLSAKLSDTRCLSNLSDTLCNFTYLKQLKTNKSQSMEKE